MSYGFWKHDRNGYVSKLLHLEITMSWYYCYRCTKKCRQKCSLLYAVVCWMYSKLLKVYHSGQQVLRSQGLLPTIYSHMIQWNMLWCQWCYQLFSSLYHEIWIKDLKEKKKCMLLKHWKWFDFHKIHIWRNTNTYFNMLKRTTIYAEYVCKI